MTAVGPEAASAGRWLAVRPERPVSVAQGRNDQPAIEIDRAQNQSAAVDHTLATRVQNRFDDRLGLLPVEQRSAAEDAPVRKADQRIRHEEAVPAAARNQPDEAAARVRQRLPCQARIATTSRKATRCWAAARAKPGSRKGFGSSARPASWLQASAMSAQAASGRISIVIGSSGRGAGA